ncbi:MAG: hypothetical protein JOZ59_00105 [Candidatus Eremiobacteraeota bacterium]|nr:hypothetical protein [Candidatus Eremiobacteraeota bacterium]
MGSPDSYGAQVLALVLAAFWPILVLGLVVASWIGDLIPSSLRSKIARRGPKTQFTTDRRA